MNLYSIPPLLTLCCFVALAALTIFRGRWTKTNILFFSICLLGSFLYTDILLIFNVKSAETALSISRTDHFFIVYLFPVYIHFFHSYLNVPGRKWLVRTAYAYAFILMCFTPLPLYIESMQKHFFGYFAKGGILFLFFSFAGLFVTVYVMHLIFNAIQNETSSIRKNRLKYLFFGFGTMGLLNGLSILPIHGYSFYPPGNLSFIPLVVFAIGLFKHNLLDMGALIKKSLVYSIITACLTCFYALIIITVDRVFKEVNFADSIYFSILFFLLIAFVFGPLKSKIQIFIDGIFHKGKYDYQKTIKHVSQMIVSVLDYDEITKHLMDVIVDAMRIEHCSLFLWNSSGSAYENVATRGDPGGAGYSTPIPDESALVKFMRKHHQAVIRKNLKEQDTAAEIQDALSDMNVLNAEISLPMTFKSKLNGFIVLGEKLSGDLFIQNDMDLLETLASQSALAIENARSYALINDLNKSLETKVEERTLALKEALYEKEQTQEQLIRSESLAAIGQLVAGVAHELNNPLASVTSLVQATIEDIRQWDKQSTPGEDLIDDLTFADKELGRAKSIVSSLLGLSRQTQTYSEAVNIGLVVKDALRVLQNQYKHQAVDIIENYATDLPYVHGNFANLGQVALNIIQNAIQAVIDRNGTVFLSTQFDADTGHVVFLCRDTGPGIPESIRQDIFKPFFTTKAVGEGTGLGLYLCHEIIQKHKGTVTLEDADGPGTGFEVRLPADIQYRPPT